MSKRIDELWGQALDQAVPDTYSSLSWTQVEKIKAVFAELIVKECGEFLKEFQVDPKHLQNDWDKGANWVYGEADSLLKKHFGVEE